MRRAGEPDVPRARTSAESPRNPAWPWSGTLALAVALFYLPLLTSPAGTVLDAADFTKYFVPIHEFARSRWLAGHWPLWDPFTYAGIPFAANPQTMVNYPPTWLCLVMPVAAAHRFLIVLHALVAAFGMRLYLRRVGLGGTAALFGALPFALGGYFTTNASVGHLTMAFAMAWLPLILASFEAFQQSRRFLDLFRCGALLGVQFLAGEPQSSYYTALLLGAYGAWGAWVRGRESASPARWGILARAILALVLVGGVAALAAAVQLLPTLEMVRESDRGGRSFEFSTGMSMPLESLLAGLVLPWYSSGLALWTDARGVAPLNVNREFAIYVGIVPLLLAGLALRQPSGHARLARGVAVGAVILMLGNHTPLYRLAFDLLPGLALFRIPARANLLFGWALCVLSAFGMQRLQDEGAGWPRWRAVGAALSGLVMALLVVRSALGIWGLDPGGGLRILPFADPLFVRPFLALWAAVLLLVVLPRLSRRTTVAALFVLTLVDLFAAAPRFPLRPSSPEREESLARFARLKAAREAGSPPFRVDLAPSHADALAAMNAGVENVNGYWPVSLARIFAYVHEMRGNPPSPNTRHQFFDGIYASETAFPLPLLNVRFASWFDPARQQLVVVENLKPTPRAWMVDRGEVTAGPEASLLRLRARDYDPFVTALFEQPPVFALVPGEGSPGTVEVRSIEPEEIRFSARSSRPVELVVSLPFYPGWKALVNGREAMTERVDYLLTGVPLGAGTHEVVLVYDPWTFKAGAALTLLYALLLVGLEMVAYGRRNATAPAVIPAKAGI